LLAPLQASIKRSSWGRSFVRSPRRCSPRESTIDLDEVPCDEALRCCTAPATASSSSSAGRRPTPRKGAAGAECSGRSLAQALCAGRQQHSRRGVATAAALPPAVVPAPAPPPPPAWATRGAGRRGSWGGGGGDASCVSQIEGCEPEPLSWDVLSLHDLRKSVTGAICIPVVYKTLEQACGDVTLDEFGGRLFVKELKSGSVAGRVGVHTGHEFVSIRIGSSAPRPPEGGLQCLKLLDIWGKEVQCTRRVAFFFMGFVGAFPAEVRVSPPSILDPFGLKKTIELMDDAVFEVVEAVSFSPSDASLLFVLQGGGEQRPPKDQAPGADAAGGTPDPAFYSPWATHGQPDASSAGGEGLAKQPGMFELPRSDARKLLRGACAELPPRVPFVARSGSPRPFEGRQPGRLRKSLANSQLHDNSLFDVAASACCDDDRTPAGDPLCGACLGAPPEVEHRHLPSKRKPAAPGRGATAAAASPPPPRPQCKGESAPARSRGDGGSNVKGDIVGTAVARAKSLERLIQALPREDDGPPDPG